MISVHGVDAHGGHQLFGTAKPAPSLALHAGAIVRSTHENSGSTPGNPIPLTGGGKNASVNCGYDVARASAMKATWKVGTTRMPQSHLVTSRSGRPIGRSFPFHGKEANPLPISSLSRKGRGQSRGAHKPKDVGSSPARCSRKSRVRRLTPSRLPGTVQHRNDMGYATPRSTQALSLIVQRIGRRGSIPGDAGSSPVRRAKSSPRSSSRVPRSFSKRLLDGLVIETK